MANDVTGAPTALAPKPAHVPDDLVVDFDIYHLPGGSEDPQLAYRAFQQTKPDIFWTPRNGGHWVATRAEDIEVMQRDYERFSHKHITIPPMVGYARQVPLEVDPPEHGVFRRPLMQALLPRMVAQMESKIREVTVSLIDAFSATGECEFIEQFAKVLPIYVFLDLVDLPRSDREYLLPWAEQSTRGATVEQRAEAWSKVAEYVEAPIVERRRHPGTDLLSQLMQARYPDGQEISHGDAVSFGVLVLFGGLDTVASMLGFIARFLATHPEHRRQIRENLHDDGFMRTAVEELLRRHGIANTARCVAKDLDYKGVHFRAGDMVLPPNLLVGLDERKVPDPLTVDLNRPFPNGHAVFGNGPHTCPGAVLARREIHTFLKEWFARIPDFEIKPGTHPVIATGMVNGVLELWLSWPPRA